jgi:hypothetical protein
MRSIGWLLGLGFGVLACTSDTTPAVYVDLAYQVRCNDCQPRVTDESAHPIKAVNGEGDLDLRCRAESSSGVKRVNIRAAHFNEISTSNYAFTIENGSLEGDESEGPCRLEVIEGNDTFEGACGTDEPTEDRPCQVKFSLEKGVVKGTAYCHRITKVGVPSEYRYVVLPGERAEPATFQVYGCADL